MISMIHALILSYVNKYGRIDLIEIQTVINEPIGLIAWEAAALYADGYLRKSENGYEVTEKGLHENVSLWNIWLENKKDEDDFGIEENYPKKVNSTGIPYFKNVNELHNILKLEHVDCESYHMFTISKKHKNRIITAPSKNLKLRQRWILKYILNKVELPDCVHGFVEHKSIVTNAKCC